MLVSRIKVKLFKFRYLGIIQKQGIQNTVITYVGIAIGFVSLIFIQPHLLRTEELGLTRILLSASGLVATVLPLGISNVNVRFFPYFRNKEKGHHGYFPFMLLFPLVGMIICSVLMFFLKDLLVAQYKAESGLFVDYFHLVLPLALFISLNIALNSYAFSLFYTVFPAFVDGVLNRFLLIFIIVLYYYKWISLDAFITCFAGIYLLQAVIVFAYIMIVDRPSFRIDKEKVREVGLRKIIQYGILLTLTAVSSVSLKYLDSVMLGKYLDLAYVGIFSVTAFIATVIEAPLNSLERIANTSVAHAWAAGNREEISKIYNMSVRYMMLIGGLLLVGIVTNVRDLLVLLPSDFSKGINVAIILSVSAFINVSTGVNNAIIFTSEKYVYGSVFLLILLVSAIIFNIVLIPIFGIDGAAFATAFSSIAYNLLKFFFIWMRFKMQPYDWACAKNALLILVCFGIAYFLPVHSKPILAIAERSFVIGVLYVTGAYFLRIAPELHKHIPFIGNKK